MARYRQKDETDLLWNSIRRRITRELDTQIAEWREEALNKLLSKAWEQYSAALSKGKTLELDAKYGTFVSAALADAMKDVKVEDEAA